jgi:Predicted signal transduction protein with a C-terminal ATPase domain
MFKLRLAFLAPFAFFMLAIVYILSVYYRESAVEDMMGQLRYEDEIIAQSLEAKIRNAETLVNTVIIQLNEMLGEEYLSGGGPDIDMPTQQQIYRCMINTFADYDDERIMVVWNNGVSWYQNWTENYSMQKDGKPLLKEMKALEINKKGSWLRSIRADCRIKGEGYYFAKQYTDIATGKSLGYVVLKISNVFESIENENSRRSFYLFDPYARLVITTDRKTEETYGRMEEQSERDRFSSRLSEALLLRAADEKQGAGTGQVVNVRAVNKRWRLFSVTDTGEELRGLNVTIASILTVSLLIAVIIFVIISRVIGRVILPIQTLSRHMAGIRDVLPMPVDMGRRKDEVGALAAGFNEMTGRNRELVELLLEEKKRQEQLKLSLLQSQIKPHFLYNTLDTIYCLVLMGKKEEAGRMTKLLSDYYRHVLSNGMDWVLLFEEIKYTSNYLQIQSIRYNDILDFEICVEEEVENIKIPKLTLQPLVENAIYHGIKPLDRKGHIRVLVKQKEDIVYLRVQDDGVGLSGERFWEVLQKGAQSGDSFGLRNVAERLHLYYGERCALELEERAQGTTILICIQTAAEIMQ